MNYDVVIVGGAAMGSSVAWHLASDPAFKGRIAVIERDPSYAACASALSAASIRQQFSSPVNIRLSLYGIQFLRQIGAHLAVNGERPDIGLHEGGYLYLASEQGADTLRALNFIQRAEGADVCLLAPDKLHKRFGWLDPDGIACGNLGLTGEGWFDGWGLMQALRKGARSRGVDYIADTVIGMDHAHGRIHSVQLASGQKISCDTLVNCAGARGTDVAAMAGIHIPVVAKQRYVFTFTCRSNLTGFPLLIDPSGIYVRPEGHLTVEGQMFICGTSPKAGAHDPDWDNNDIAANAIDWSLFEDMIWPALAARVPAFAGIRPGRAWAGPYDMNMLDANAIIGPAESIANLYLCNGFSGHGLQHCPGIGRGIAEHILHGRYLTLDLCELGHARIVEGRPLRERNVI
jgi:FAD-dependent oxidoreductase domain-containing protein 1